MFNALRNSYARITVALALALTGALAFAAPASPAAALDATQIATDGVSSLTGLVTSALPFIVAAIGLAIVLRWVRKVFKF